MANAIIIQQVTALATRAGQEAADLRTLIGNTATAASNDLTTAIGLVNGKIGVLTGLDTTANTNLVDAINEVKGLADTAKGAADAAATAASGLILDTATNTDTTKTYSAKKITDSITSSVNTAVSGLVDGSIAGLDTLKELAAAINNDTSYAATVTTALGTKLVKTANLSDLSDVAVSRTNLAVYSKTEVDALVQAVSNSIGDTSNVDLVALFDTASGTIAPVS